MSDSKPSFALGEHNDAPTIEEVWAELHKAEAQRDAALARAERAEARVGAIEGAVRALLRTPGGLVGCGVCRAALATREVEEVPACDGCESDEPGEAYGQADVVRAALALVGEVAGG